MLEALSDLPDNVVGYEAKGQVTAEDYESTLVPAIDQAREKHGKVRFIYVLGDDFDGYSLGATWDDMKLGVHNRRSFERARRRAGLGGKLGRSFACSTCRGH